jgi:small subunit ribosomal protein S11
MSPKPNKEAVPAEPKEAAASAPTSEAPKSEDVKVKAAPRRKKAKRSVPAGQVHIQATFNNTIVTFADPLGSVLAWSSAGSNGFRGSKKGTAYAAQVAAERAGQAAKAQYGMTKADVFVSGIGLGRESAVRSLQNLDIRVESIHDVTGVPHGGVRPRKARRT